MNTPLSIRISGKPDGSFILLVLYAALAVSPAAKAQIRAPQIPSGGIAEITASGPQRREGAVYIADQDVDVHYAGMRLQADHVEYNTDTSDAAARGHVISTTRTNTSKGMRPTLMWEPAVAPSLRCAGW